MSDLAQEIALEHARINLGMREINEHVRAINQKIEDVKQRVGRINFLLDAGNGLIVKNSETH